MTERDTCKWACEYCTYDNYPATNCCTLCRAPRPLHYIADIQNEEQDIYKVAETMGHNKDSSIGVGVISCSSSTTSATGYDPSHKWACPKCTYLNWPQTNKCTQCMTIRNSNRLSPTGSASPTQARSQSYASQVPPSGGNLKTTESSRAKRGTSLTRKEVIPLSPKAAKAKPSKVNDINNKTLTNYAKVKWTCKSCTYENWPKSTKCVMCGVSRGRTSPEISSVSSSADIFSPVNKGTCSPTSSMASGENIGQAEKQTVLSEYTFVSPSSSSAAVAKEGNLTTETKLKQVKNCMRERDWLWLNACHGVVNGDTRAVEAFVAAGGDPSRQLTQEEVTLLSRPSAFEAGYTLVHLAIRFRREDMLAALLTMTESSPKAVKRLPSHLSADLASEIRREISAMLRQRKGEFPCQFLNDFATFALPSGVRDLPISVQSQIFNEILDGDVQKELEEEFVINWSVELTDRLGSRLYALWNRTAGDCLLDSILQSSWGIFDTDNSLRQAMSDSLNDGAMTFYPRWKEYESMHAEMLNFTLDEAQWQHDWADLLSIACTPGASLEQIHIFALAHILRRPIIIYGVKYVKSFRGETIGIARFQGVYLPMLWERGFCWKSPITLSYTRGHFSALVPMEMMTDDAIGAGADIDNSDEEQVNYLPLMDGEGKLLPVHFLRASETGREETILREWLDCCVTKGGSLVALQKIGKRPVLVKRMLEDWLDHYRQLSHTLVSNSTTPSLATQTFSSDGESDQE